MALSRRDKKRIADLRKKQRSSLVFRNKQRLNENQMQERRNDIEDQIRDIQSGGRVTPRSSTTSRSTQNNGFMDQLRLNTGGFVPRTPTIDRTPITRRNLMPDSRVSSINQENLSSILNPVFGNFFPQINRRQSVQQRDARPVYDGSEYIGIGGGFDQNLVGRGLFNDYFKNYSAAPYITPPMAVNRFGDGQQRLPSDMDMNFLEFNNNNNIENRQREPGFGFDLFGNPSNMGLAPTPRFVQDMSGVAPINQENLNTILNPTYGNFAPTGRFSNGAGSFFDSTLNNPQRFDGLSYGDVVPSTPQLPPNVNKIPTLLGLMNGIQTGFGLF